MFSQYSLQRLNVKFHPFPLALLPTGLGWTCPLSLTPQSPSCLWDDSDPFCRFGPLLFAGMFLRNMESGAPGPEPAKLTGCCRFLKAVSTVTRATKRVHAPPSHRHLLFSAKASNPGVPEGHGEGFHCPNPSSSFGLTSGSPTCTCFLSVPWHCLSLESLYRTVNRLCVGHGSSKGESSERVGLAVNVVPFSRM